MLALMRSKWPCVAFDSLFLILASFRWPIALCGILADSDMVLSAINAAFRTLAPMAGQI